MNIKIKYIFSIFFVLLIINLIKSESSDAPINTSEDDDESKSQGSGSVWSDGNGDLNSIEFCPSPKILCPKGSYRDTDERVHLVSYCIDEGEQCCGCNSVQTPHRYYNGTDYVVDYIKVGVCFGCSNSSTCEFQVFSDGLQRHCATKTSDSNSLLKNPISTLLILLISILALII